MNVGPTKYCPNGGRLVFSHYPEDGTTAIQVVNEKTGEPEYTATVCLAPATVADGHIWLRNWNECEEVPRAFELAGVVELLDIFMPTGRVFAQLAKLTPAALAEQALRYANDPAAAAARLASRKDAE